MATNIKAIIQQLKGAPHVLRIIAAIIAIDVIVILIALLVLEDTVGARQEKISQLKTQLAGVEEKTLSTRKEIARLPELHKLYDLAIANGVLAGQDRLKFVTLAQELVRNHRLTDFRFKLAPETATPLPNSKYQLTSTEILLTNTALRGSDVFAFWEEILKRSQAHYQITSATIERLPVELKTVLANIKSGNTAELIKAELKFKWQSMRVPQETEKVAVPAKAASATPAAPTPAAAPAPAAEGTN